MPTHARRPFLAVLAAALVAGCGGGAGPATSAASSDLIDPGDGGDYRVELNPADFVTGIDNPWFPLQVGSRWAYEDVDGALIEVVVTPEMKTIAGVSATVVRVTESRGDSILEDTFDWYAQDRDGNVWYLGEDTTANRGGSSTTAGSWEAGVDGAQPGIVMKADPEIGQVYRQEFYLGHAEDMAEVVRVDESVVVPFSEFQGVLVTKEWSPLEPAVLEEKFYARGVGLIRERHVQGGSGVVDLVAFEPAQ
jgi:hypothetical protein